MQQQIKSVEKYRFNTFSDNDTAESVEITGFLMSRILFDKNGNITETKTFDSDEEVEEHIQYIYNDAGLKTEEILFDQDEIAERHEFIYDDNKLILKELIYYQDDVYDTLNYDYDEEKRIVKRTLVDSDNDMRYYITDSQLISDRVINGDKYYIYILTLLAKEDVPDKHIKIKASFVARERPIEFYNFESIKIDRYYKGELDNYISKIKYSSKEVQGTIMLERDNDSLITYFKQNYFGSLTDEDIMELILQNT